MQLASSPSAQWSDLDLRSFDLVTPNAGWVLLHQRLYWTANRGRAWRDITPPAPSGYEIRDVSFADAVSGWALLSQGEPPATSYLFAHTENGGNSWDSLTIDFFQPGDLDALSRSVWVRQLDAQIGWVVFRRATSSNFSVGTMFKTEDGGNSWTRLPVPLGEPVYFVDPNNGWIAGGPAGDRLFRTRDGGRTWQQVQVAPSDARPAAIKFSDTNTGIISLVSPQKSTSQVHFYTTRDAGNSWELSSSVILNQEIDTRYLPLALTDSNNWLLVAPSDQQVWASVSAGAPRAMRSADTLLSGIRELDMPTSSVGWARYAVTECDIQAGQIKHVGQCTNTTQLLLTEDGQAWRSVTPPQDAQYIAQAFRADIPIGSGQGFDKCQVGSITNLQTWWNTSPYNVTNLYIGGAARSCENEVLSSSYLRDLSRIGWKFIPTWVGPQAACQSPITYGTNIMSYDVTTAYNQGIAEAEAASLVASQLALTSSGRPGTVIYYDLEAYPGGTACRAAASAFVDGWTVRLHAKGITAGVYAASMGSYPTDFVELANVPDALWVANWVRSGYDPAMTVWGAVGLDDTLWLNHSRLRQYAGNVNETWGNVTLYIDPDVLDGPVAEYCGSPQYLSAVGNARGAAEYQVYVPYTAKTVESTTTVLKLFLPLVAKNSTGTTVVTRTVYLPFVKGSTSSPVACVL